MGNENYTSTKLVFGPTWIAYSIIEDEGKIGYKYYLHCWQTFRRCTQNLMVTTIASIGI